MRRSARKALPTGSSLWPGVVTGVSGAPGAADVARKLEATQFCYEGNPGLTPAAASGPADDGAAGR